MKTRSPLYAAVTYCLDRAIPLRVEVLAAFADCCPQRAQAYVSLLRSRGVLGHDLSPGPGYAEWRRQGDAAPATPRRYGHARAYRDSRDEHHRAYYRKRWELLAIAAEIVAKREALGLAQRELAEEAQIPPTSLCMLEKGRRGTRMWSRIRPAIERILGPIGGQ
ncbi:MAG: helix-turn-helix transcriptional regulator [Chloroflexi bacterium]|nr:helix-turn-helix transcriptional regulator [Chloroflexota bacterium]